MRNLSGCDAANLNTNEGTILIDSRADRFAANVHGCTLFASASIGAAASNANDNTLRFVAHGSVFTDNSGPLPANIPWAGGVVALGGANGTGVPRRENRNSLQILRWGTSFGRNQIVDINAFGGVSLNPMVFPGSGNHVDIELHGVSKFATCLVTPSSPADPDGSNTVSIVPMVQCL